MKVLVTGGAGYIGSTICSALEEKGHLPIVLDTLVNGREEFICDRIFYKGDICDEQILKRIFNENTGIECVIHCAALIFVPESMEKPYEYYNENVAKSISFFNILNKLGCNNVIFSSSASIYDDIEGFMVKESSPKNPRSPYARTKFMIEMILEDYCKAYDMRGIALRYFNVIGADPRMRTGMYAKNPSHILGRLVKVASREEEKFYITGDKWPTRDGSGIRDYIHVWDVATAHVSAVERIGGLSEDNRFIAMNIGRGDGVTVKEFVKQFEKVIGQEINKEVTFARAGDVAGAYSNVELSKNVLGWQAELSIDDGIRHALEWDKVSVERLSYHE